jgi:hypothetical protein
MGRPAYKCPAGTGDEITGRTQCFYADLSDHLEKHRGSYYNALTRVRESNDIGHWVRFFLQAVVETAESGKRTFQCILTLRQELDAEILKLGRRTENAQQLILYLYGTPTITVNRTMEILASQICTSQQLDRVSGGYGSVAGGHRVPEEPDFHPSALYRYIQGWKLNYAKPYYNFHGWKYNKNFCV